MFQFDTFNNWNTPRSTRQHYILIIYYLSTLKKFYLKNGYAVSTNSKVQ